MSSVAKLQKEVQELLSIHKSLKVLENGKVKCQLSGHEMLCKLDVIEQYVSGKKYMKLSKESELDLSLYREHIEPNSKTGHEHQLFCKLTWKTINNTPEGIKNHIQGKKFQRALARWKTCQENGTPFRPSQASFSKKKNIKEDSDDDEDDNKSVDSLSDLYPAEDFQNLNLKDNDEDGENDEIEENNKEHGVKRKSTQKTLHVRVSKTKRSKLS